MSRRDRGVRQPDQVSAMSGTACDVAVSEMTGWSLEEICGYIVLVVRHRPDQSHELSIMPHADAPKWVQQWLDRAAADWRSCT